MRVELTLTPGRCGLEKCAIVFAVYLNQPTSKPRAEDTNRAIVNSVCQKKGREPYLLGIDCWYLDKSPLPPPTASPSRNYF